MIKIFIKMVMMLTKIFQKLKGISFMYLENSLNMWHPHACLNRGLQQCEMEGNSLRDKWLYIITAWVISICFFGFLTDCLTNKSEELSNSTVYFLNQFNHTLTCFENNLQVFLYIILEIKMLFCPNE